MNRYIVITQQWNENFQSEMLTALINRCPPTHKLHSVQIIESNILHFWLIIFERQE